MGSRYITLFGGWSAIIIYSQVRYNRSLGSLEKGEFQPPKLWRVFIIAAMDVIKRGKQKLRIQPDLTLVNTPGLSSRNPKRENFSWGKWA